MAQLRHATTSDRQSFPSADFAASDAVPISQCEDSPISSINAATVAATLCLRDVAAFTGLNFTYDKCHITAPPGTPPAEYVIQTNNDDALLLTAPLTDQVNVHYHLEPWDPPLLAGTGVQTIGPAKTLLAPGQFAGVAVNSRICVITFSPTGNTGEFLITGNSANSLLLATDPGTSANVSYFIKAAVDLSNTQTVNEIMLAAQAAGAATMIKGGQLYIDGIEADLSQACKINLNPA